MRGPETPKGLRRRRRAALVGAAVAALVFPACAVGHSGGGGSLSSALGSVSDSGPARAVFRWENLAEARLLDGVGSAKQYGSKAFTPEWQRIAGLGVPAAAAVEPQFTDATGIDILAGSQAISIGVARQNRTAAGRVDGADAKAVQATFTKLKAGPVTAFGRTFLELAGENRLDLGSDLPDGVAFVINRAVVAGTTVAFGRANAPVADILGSNGPPLSKLAGYEAMASCLGKVFVAEIRAPVPGDPAGTTLVGFGILTPVAPTSPATEVVCVSTSTRGRALQLRTTVRHRLAAGSTLPAEGEQVQSFFSTPTISTAAAGRQPGVRIVLPDLPQTRAGFVFDADASGELPYLIGGQRPRMFAPLTP